VENDDPTVYQNARYFDFDPNTPPKFDIFDVQAHFDLLGDTYYDIDNISTNDPIVGENLTISVTVTNEGPDSQAQLIVADVPGLGTEYQQADLDAGESGTYTLAIGTEPGDAGNYTANVSTANDAIETPVTVRGRYR
jgi:uncharacterized repeat protein (TIGR01451 family)